MPANIAVDKPQKNQMVAKARTAVALPADIREELQADALLIKERIGAPSGDSISIDRNKAFRLPSGETSTELFAIILDWATLNQFYEGKFDSNAIKPPVCAAQGAKIAELKPVPTAPKPQAENCHDCPKNQWGSDGKGKACKNTRVLAVIAKDVVEDGPILLLKVSPAALKHIDPYLAKFQNHPDCPHPLGVVTKIYFGPEDYPCLRFDIAEANDAGTIATAAVRRKDARARLQILPDLGGKVAGDA